ncbi:MAG: 2-oxoglutarate dehydrogenase E1 component, partial [Pseudomonadota bacterium]
VSRPPVKAPDRAKAAQWEKYLGTDWDIPCNTAVPIDRPRHLPDSLLALPPSSELHPRVAKIMENRHKMAVGALPLDWGFTENMAYASILMDGHNVRLTGQDVGRGTFFHRHAIVYNQINGEHFIPLKHLPDSKARAQIFDSLLSEAGVLGFEYGYSTAEPETLLIWEAQFGDFVNNAQVVIDQFISSGETKWGRLCGLTLFLPHGYEGQGPEHSSARLERFLQLSAEQNIQVCSPTTPAQIFHLLRRQILRPFRKPLVVMSPKSLLRHKLAVSSLEDLTECCFQPVIGEIDEIAPKKVKRVVLCSGKIFFDLLEARRAYAEELQHVAIIRMEQLYPFPLEQLSLELEKCPNLDHLIWCQEEPKNQGAWYQIKHRFLDIAGANIELSYVGRPISAAPAVGYFSLHAEQQYQIIDHALFGTISEP